MAFLQPGAQIIRGARVTIPGQRRAEPADILVIDGLIYGDITLYMPPEVVLEVLYERP